MPRTKDTAKARTEQSVRERESEGGGQRPGSCTDGMKEAKADEGKRSAKKDSESPFLKESNGEIVKNESSNGAVGTGHNASETLLSETWKQANPPSPDHTSVGGIKRERAIANLRSEIQDDGKSPRCTGAKS